MSPYSNADQAAWKLFRVFSRVEYALKATGYNKGDGAAEADWQKFAGAIDQTINATEDPKLRTAINFLLNSPPKNK